MIGVVVKKIIADGCLLIVHKQKAITTFQQPITSDHTLAAVRNINTRFRIVCCDGIILNSGSMPIVYKYPGTIVCGVV